jgi:hypothetical protein
MSEVLDNQQTDERLLAMGVLAKRFRENLPPEILAEYLKASDRLLNQINIWCWQLGVSCQMTDAQIDPLEFTLMRDAVYEARYGEPE